MLGLADLDAILVVGERRIPLGVHEWASGVIDPTGYIHLEGFTLEDGLPRWRWAVGDVVVERTVAMMSGRSAVAIVHRIVRAPQAVGLELHPLCTWRDVHGERCAGAAPAVETTALGFSFEGAYQVAAPGFAPDAAWYRDARYRVEAARGLNDREDLWHPGSFRVQLQAGETHELVAWGAPFKEAPPPAAAIVRRSGERARSIVAAAGAGDEAGRLLALAADQFIVSGPTVVAGYPWFGDWSRDTMTSYQGLFLQCGRSEEGRALLLRMAGGLSEGMLANTTDAGAAEYNTADATVWFLHAARRHIVRTNDHDLADRPSGSLLEVIANHLAGRRYGIKVDPAHSLLRHGSDGLALTSLAAPVHRRPLPQPPPKP